jgi:hypothetical protein
VTDSATDSALWGENVGGGYGVAGATTSGAGGPPACQGVNGGAGDGVFGSSVSGDAVHGTTAGAGNALHATNTNSGANGNAVFGEHTGGGSGVVGQTNSSGRAGVAGINLGGGAGVRGTTGNGTGVQGLSGAAGAIGTSGTALATGAIGVEARTNVSDGTALNVAGPATFSLSGVAHIGAGHTQAVVTGVSLRTTSLVLATLQNSIGVYVVAAVPNVARSKITIVLNAVVPASHTAKIAWFVVN